MKTPFGAPGLSSPQCSQERHASLGCMTHPQVDQQAESEPPTPAERDVEMHQITHPHRSPGQDCSQPGATSLAAPGLNESISGDTSVVHSCLTNWEVSN